MKALTLWRPWPYVIFHPDPEKRKTIENRTWAPPAPMFGQLIAIHAGKRWDRDGAEYIEDIIGEYRDDEDDPSGVIVGVVRVVRVFNDDHHKALHAMGRRCDPLTRSPWAFGPVCWVLEDAIPFAKPIPCRGAQGLWNVPDPIEAEIADYLEQAEHAQGWYGPDFRRR
jgi:hypothetical protein